MRSETANVGWRQRRLLNEIQKGGAVCYPGIHPAARRSFIALSDRGLIDVQQGGWARATLTEAGRRYLRDNP